MNQFSVWQKLTHHCKSGILQYKKKKLWYTKEKREITAKEPVHKIEKQPTDWEKTFTNDMANKRLIIKICKQLIQLNIKKA